MRIALLVLTILGAGGYAAERLSWADLPGQRGDYLMLTLLGSLLFNLVRAKEVTNALSS